MWSVYLTSNSVAENLAKNRTSVVRAFLNARYYSSAQGQFLSEDPVFLGNPTKQNLANPQSLNSYSYANDNPINRSDPSGLSVKTGLQGLLAQLSSTLQALAAHLSQPAIVQQYQAARTGISLASNPGATWNGAKSYVSSTASALNTIGHSDSGDYLLGRRAVQLLPLMIGGLGAEGDAAEAAAAETIPSDVVLAGSRSMLSSGAKDALQGYEENGWQKQPNLKSPQVFQNRSGQLPAQSDPNYYMEFYAGPKSGAERFVTGQNGEMYYTWTHYGDAGSPAFINIPSSGN